MDRSPTPNSLIAFFLVISQPYRLSERVTAAMPSFAALTARQRCKPDHLDSTQRLDPRPADFEHVGDHRPSIIRDPQTLGQGDAIDGVAQSLQHVINGGIGCARS